MSIYTRRGDRGETSLADGTRIRKDSARVEAYGAVDEANSAVGPGPGRGERSAPGGRPALRPAAAVQLLCCARIPEQRALGRRTRDLNGRRRGPRGRRRPFRGRRPAHRRDSSSKAAASARPGCIWRAPSFAAPNAELSRCPPARTGRRAGPRVSQSALRHPVQRGALRQCARWSRTTNSGMPHAPRPRRRLDPPRPSTLGIARSVAECAPFGGHLSHAEAPVRYTRLTCGAERSPVRDDRREVSGPARASQAARQRARRVLGRSRFHTPRLRRRTRSSATGARRSSPLRTRTLPVRPCPRVQLGEPTRLPPHRGRDLRTRRSAIRRQRARSLLPLQDRAVRPVAEGRRGRGPRPRRRRQQRRRPVRPSPWSPSRRRTRRRQPARRRRPDEGRHPDTRARTHPSELGQAVHGVSRVAVPLRRADHR